MPGHSIKVASVVGAMLVLGLPAFAQESSSTPPPQRTELHLQCAGEASFTRAHHGWASASESRSGSLSENGSFGAGGSFNGGGTFSENGSTTIATTSLDEDRINDDVLVDITGDQGRIRFPRRMLPPLHSGDQEGWRSISPLTVNGREIRGQFSMNFINKPSVSIDRVTGRIEIVGHRDFGFRGDCRAYDPNRDRKF